MLSSIKLIVIIYVKTLIIQGVHKRPAHIFQNVIAK